MIFICFYKVKTGSKTAGSKFSKFFLFAADIRLQAFGNFFFKKKIKIKNKINKIRIHSHWNAVLMIGCILFSSVHTYQ